MNGDRPSQTAADGGACLGLDGRGPQAGLLCEGSKPEGRNAKRFGLRELSPLADTRLNSRH